MRVEWARTGAGELLWGYQAIEEREERHAERGEGRKRRMGRGEAGGQQA